MNEQSGQAAAPLPIGTILSIPVIVASLGYFVDIYDLVLFSVVRVPSLKAIGLAGQALVDRGVFLLNMQMVGMLLGGVLWGILGDRRGRLKILFGSIFLYSIANIANGMASSLEAYALLRFVAGVGLAGELGAGITLVSEVLPKEVRGYGTMVVATVGVSGAIAANFVAGHFDWRSAYYIGGLLGFCLLILRISVSESSMFQEMEQRGVGRGNFLSLFTDRHRFGKYLRSILIGVPTWYVVGILITFSPEFARTLGVTGSVSAGNAVMYCYLGLVFGDFASGVLSQYLQSRRRVVFWFLILTCLGITAYYLSNGLSPDEFYVICLLLGFASGYWAIFVTIAAEQFGTNLRATVATTVPNFVRGMVVPITLAFQVVRKQVGLLGGGMVVGLVCMAIALYALFQLEETFGKELDYLEE